MATDIQRPYLPAAGHDWTLPLYDPLVKLLGGDAARRRLVDQADLHAGDRILEVGCGTGGLLMLIAREHPGVVLSGLDPDPKALARAARKAKAASISLRLDRGFSDALPYRAASFDRVFSCFMFHHLTGADERARTLAEIRRVLKPGGRLHLLDFLKPEGHAGGLVGWLHSSHHLKDNDEATMLSLLGSSGLAAPATLTHGRMMGVFRLAYYQALAPATESTMRGTISV